MSKKSNIINKGIHCKVRSYGSGLAVGTTYTACLYYSARKTEYRAEQTAVCQLATEVVNGVELQDSKYRTHSGWISPLLKAPSGNATYELIRTRNTEFRLSETKDVWLLQILKKEDATTHTYLSMTDGVVALDTSGNAATNERLYLVNKKLGVRVSRDGHWITGYLPFCVRKKTMTTGTQYGIGRWQ